MTKELVFFVYGLAFFILGFAIFLYPKKHSDFVLARHICLIAFFGVLHGINEWLDLFIIIQGSENASFLYGVRLVILPLSFIFLVHFASKVLPDRCRNCNFLGYLTWIIVGLWLLVMIVGDRSGLSVDIWSRYLICFPGAFLAGVGLFLNVPDFRERGLPGVVLDLKIAGGALIAYSIISGLIVPVGEFWPASFLNYDAFQAVFGFKVQILRAVSAGVMAYGIVRALRVFSWESTEALRRSKIRFDAVMNNSPVFIFITDENQRIVFVEGRGIESLGKNIDDVFGSEIVELFPGSSKMYDYCCGAMEGKAGSLYVSVDGVSLNVSLGALRNEVGDVEGIVGVAVDVTDLMKAQAELDKYKDEMTRSKNLAMLGTVSMSMAQQVEGPLDEARKYLFNSLNSLDRTIGAEDVKRSIKQGLAEISEAFKSINGFYSKANVHKHPKAEPVHLREMVERILAVFEDSARRGLLGFSTHGIDIVPCVFMSGRELEQMLFIPIQNAVQSAGGEVGRKVSIDFELSDGKLMLRFTDSCGGIDRDRAEGLYGLGRGGLGNGNGAGGFGLAVLGKLVEAHDGQISTENNYPDGMTLVITLPAE